MTKRSSRPLSHQTDILTRKSEVAPYSPDLAAISAAARLTASEAGQKAAQFDADEGGRRNFTVGQQSIAGIYQRVIDASSECVQLRQGIGTEEIRRITADFRQADTNTCANPKHNIITEPLDAASDEIRTTCADLRLTARPVAREDIEARAARNNFHRDHPVRPPARYSDTPMTHMAYIFAAMIFEILVNSYFFIDASDAGLIGSLFEVVFFAPINVAVAVVIGVVALRYARHRDKLPRWIGWISTAMLITFILMFNVYLAAVRLSLRPDLHLDVPSALEAIFSNHVLAIMDYESLAVFFSGLFWAGFASWEAFRLYDPYPGYTKCFRRCEDAQAALLAVQANHVKTLGQIGQKYISHLDERLSGYTRSLADLGSYQDAMAADVTRHHRLVAALRDDYCDVIHEFRAIYLAHPAHNEHDLSSIPPMDARESVAVVGDLDPVIAECNQILTRLVQLSHNSARQLSVRIVANQEFTPELIREISQDTVRSVVRPIRSAPASSNGIGTADQGIVS